MRRHLLTALVILVATSSCKPPRPPREANEVRVQGQWRGISVAHSPPADSAEIVWRLAVQEGQAGKLDGRGIMKRFGQETEFELDGIRGESFVTIEFDMPGNQVKFQGTIMDIKTMVGEVIMRNDTFPLSLARVR
jgi:hypothetical protein